MSDDRKLLLLKSMLVNVGSRYEQVIAAFRTILPRYLLRVIDDSSVIVALILAKLEHDQQHDRYHVLKNMRRLRHQLMLRLGR